MQQHCFCQKKGWEGEEGKNSSTFVMASFNWSAERHRFFSSSDFLLLDLLEALKDYTKLFDDFEKVFFM